MDSSMKECGSCESKSGCSCMCHKAVGALVVIGGAVFLAGAMGWISEMAVGYTWPVLVILAGLKCMMAGMCKCCKK